MSEPIDISPSQRKELLALIQHHLPKVEVWAFGSRVKWTARSNSDLDLVAFTKPEDETRVSRLKEAMEESSLPFKVDLLTWDNIPESFQKNIQERYVVLTEILETGQGWVTGSGWMETTIGDFAPFSYGKALPERARKPGPIPVISSAGVTGTHSEPLIKSAGIVIGRKGTVGSVTFSPMAFWPIDTTFYVADDPDLRDIRFTYYLLRTLHLDRMNSDSAVPGLNRDNAHALSIRVPKDVNEQCRIAGVLDSLDRKIDLSRRINQTLEAMAQALFKSWFVDFDPVKAKIAAKAEGSDPLRAAMRAISGQAEVELHALSAEAFETLADTAALFPDEMDASALGEIPKGWTYKALAQLTDKIGSGSTPRGGKEVYLEDGVALIRSQNVYDSLFVWEGLARISDDAANQLKGVTVQAEDVLLNITGASILRTCVVEPEVLPARVNQHVAIIRAKAGVPPRFIHMHLLRQDIKSFLLGLNAGASREAITKAHIEALTLLTPGPELLAAFERATSPLFQQMKGLAHQMRVLGGLRDTLLPKLLSGELSLAEALAELDA